MTVPRPLQADATPDITPGASQNDWPTGFMVIQGNRLESLRDLLIAWLRGHPLDPLESETILVQSNGIGQWLKRALAAPLDTGAANRDRTSEGCGIAAAIELLLPGRFLWRAYRAVLGDLPETSPYDQAPLVWRLYRLLGTLDTPAASPDASAWLAPLRGFLAADPQPQASAQRRYQLAVRLADLYDQYQVYRADWLVAWQQGEDVLIRHHGQREPLPDAQRWQPLLWRWLQRDLATADTPGAEAISRAEIHQRFLAAARTLSAAACPEDLPRRVIVFGISALPRQTIEVLHAIAPLSQVMLFVHNPSQHYWGDLVAGRDLFRHAYRRTLDRRVPDGLDENSLHLHGHPLLAAWGKQGRDYLRMLDEHDERAQYEEHFTDRNLRIDLFASPGEHSLLTQLQDDILELRSLAERRERPNAIDPRQDRSIEFLIAHSPQREIEILHDRLLDAFAQAERAGAPLHPRDLLVMVPDIATYAPHIEAVFGRLPPGDPRHIPFHIADRGQRQRNPLAIGLETLLNLPQARLTVSELLDLLDIPALRARFGLDAADLPRLRQWIRGAGIRWGLDADQRTGFDLPAGLEQNTWRFGLRRMLLGCAAGAAEPWRGVEPYDEVGGLEAALIGPLADLLDRLGGFCRVLAEARPAADWAVCIADLLDDCFRATSDADAFALAQLGEVLEQWPRDCARGGADREPLPLDVVRETLLAGLDEPTLSQRFLGGAVNVATLMPMRAIPFRQIWLLGMNDGDYPRRRRPTDFDLMAQDDRPGDRSRREDDRYLFLEALLSAREKLAISWVGRGIRDNRARPPSVLVGQLRDHLQAGWRLASPQAGSEAGSDQDSGRDLLDALTTCYPLQPFSRRYFAPGHDAAGLFTYASEWRAPHEHRAAVEEPPPCLAAPTFDGPIGLAALGRFLRHPVRTFYTQRLALHLDQEAGQEADAEPFDLAALEGWALREQVLGVVERQLAARPECTAREVLRAAIERQARAGTLPLRPFDALWREQLDTELAGPLARYRELLAAYPRLLPDPRPRHAAAGILLEDSLTGLRANDAGQRLRPILQPSALVTVSGQDRTPKWHHLARAWPAHLAAQLDGPTTTWLLGPHHAVILAPLAQDQARVWLGDLIAGYVQGLTELLPLGCRTALAWIEGVDGAARTRYEGDYQSSGERAEHPGYARYWPDFDALRDDPRFAPLIDKIYRPLREQAPRIEAL